MIKAVSRFWMNESEKERQRGRNEIEFCKDKCWNASPYWMQLAVGPFWIRIIMMKNRKQTDVGRREAEYQRFASSVLWYHCVSNPACQHCIYSIKTPLASSHGVWLLGMPSTFILHINIRCCAHRARSSLGCKAVWWNKDRHRQSQTKEKEVGKSKADCRHNWEKVVFSRSPETKALE